MLRNKVVFCLACLLFLEGVGFAASSDITLPSPQLIGRITLEEALNKRRSCRSYYPNELNLEQISQLLWSGQGITEKIWGWRTTPSNGALYPLNLYLVNKDGVYRYTPRNNKLVVITKGDKRTNLVRGSLGQSFISDAPINIIITGDYSKTAEKYGAARAARYVHIEAGHAAQNILLQAAALNLGAVPVGTFWDNVIQNCLGISFNEEPIYIIPIGYPRE